MVFSDRTSWLQELAQLFSFSETDPADPLLAYPFACSYPQTTGAPLQATALLNDSFVPTTGVYPAIRKYTHEMVEQWDAQLRLCHYLEQFAIDLEKAIAGRQQVQKEIDALKFLRPPKKITLLQERVSRYEGKITELTERLKTTTDPAAQKRLTKSIDKAETKLVFAQMDLRREMSIQSGTIKVQRFLLASRFPENVLKETLRTLSLEFDKAFLDRYRCLTIERPEEIRAIIQQIKTESQQMRAQLTIQSARVLRAFAHAAPAYLELFQDYKDLSRKRSHTDDGKKQLSILSKHLFLLYPIRLVPLTHGASFLYELGRAKLQIAIIDGTTPTNHLLLAQICSRFSKVVILDVQKEQFSLSTVPQGLKALLRKKHNITDLPPETHG